MKNTPLITLFLALVFISCDNKINGDELYDDVETATNIYLSVDYETHQTDTLYTETTSYNTKGNRVKNIIYYPATSITNTDIYFYNTRDELDSMVTESDNFSAITLYEYKQGVIKLARTNLRNGKKYAELYNTYDNKLRLIKFIKHYHDQDGDYSLTEEVSHTYNGNSFALTKDTKLSKYGTTVITSKFTYKRDSYHNIISEHKLNKANKWIEVKKHIYEYDSHNNWIKKTTQNGDHVESIITRCIIYKPTDK